MKKIRMILFIQLLIFSLCACTGSKTIYTVYEDGKTFEVNAEEGIIFDGIHTYQYSFSGDSEDYSIDITYPNGSTFWWSSSSTGGHGGWSEDYVEGIYVSEDTLCDVILEEAPDPPNQTNLIVVIFLIGIGLFNIFAPNDAWQLNYGWRFKNAEPSDAAIEMNRIGGIIAIIVGVFIIFI